MAKTQRSEARRRWIGLSLIIFGALSLVISMVSPAAATPAMTVTPSTGLTNGQTVSVTGSGYGASAPGAIIQCNNTTPQPTIVVFGNAAPVSCTNPLSGLINFDATGALAATNYVVHTGTVGPPGSGTDSDGHDAAADAALFPCPPTAAQQAAGFTCQLALADLSGQRATKDITFVGQGGGTTTSTAQATTSTTKASTTSSTAGATTTTTHASTTSTTKASTTTSTAAATTTTTAAPSGPAVTVNPNSGLNNGDTVSVTGTGYDHSAAGAIIQCNDDPNQPTIAVFGNPVPVSCTNPLSGLINFDAAGALAATNFVVHTGTVGPPGTGTDSAGHDAAADAANYPCPPTAAQQAAGVNCIVALADLSAHRATKTITFEGQTPPSSTTSTTTGGSTTTSVAPGAVVTPSANSTSPGGTLTLTGTGFPGSSTLDVTFLSTPVSLGTVQTNATGGFAIAVTIPPDASVGSHHIQIATKDGAVKVSIPIEIVAAGTPAPSTTSATVATTVLGTQTSNGNLAFTGSGTGWLTIGIFCLVLGAMLFFNSRPLVPSKR